MSCSYATKAELTAITEGGLPSLTDIDAFWLVINGEVVFVMQVGFMLLEVGSVRAQHAKAICVKNVIDFLVATCTWLCFGYPFAFGERGAFGDFLGTSNFFGDGLDVATTDWAGFFFQWTFASATCTIVSGAGAERCSFQGYLLSTVMLSAVVYPMVVHWCWSSDAWLANGSHNDIAFFDFAGSGVVHMTGGSVAFMLINAIGAREGRFNEKGEVQSLSPHNLVLAAAGTLLLIMGWFGFNGGSVLAASGGNSALAGRVCAITAIGASAGGLTAFFIVYFQSGFIKLEVLMNGMLAGCVSVTAGASVLNTWTALASGIIGGLVYNGSSWALLKFKMDDPLDASPIHGAAGIWGLLAVGLFADNDGQAPQGMFYAGNLDQVSYQIVGILVICAWCMGFTGVIYNSINLYKKTILRVPLDIELTGDLVLYGGSAYPQFETESVPPEGDICCLITDVQSSTALWEWNADVMKQSIEVHECLLRDNTTRFQGYEIMDEGDSLSIVFHNAFDAMMFSMMSQKDLMTADWPEDLYQHDAGSKIGTLYSGLRIRMAIAVGFTNKFLNRSTNRLSYDGPAVEDCAAILKAVDAGGITVCSKETMEQLYGKYSHRLHELGPLTLIDIGKYQLPKMPAPTELIQIMPTELFARPETTISGGTQLLKGYNFAPGVVTAGAAVAMVFCSLTDTTGDKKAEADVIAVLDECAAASEGYITKTSNNITLLAFHTTDSAMQFCRDINTKCTTTHPALRFTAGVHHGPPVSVSPNKQTGRADYLGPVVNATARLMGLAADNKAFKAGSVSVAVSVVAYNTLDQKGGLQAAGKFNLKGISDGMETYAMVSVQ